jgi:hypothetical protein
MSKQHRNRFFQLVAALLACHLVPLFGATVSAPPALVLWCYLLAVAAAFGADWLIYEARP